MTIGDLTKSIAVEPSEQKDFTYEMLIDGLKQGNFKKIIILTGAGISVSAGIPDYRSAGGVFENLDMTKHGLIRPEEKSSI